MTRPLALELMRHAREPCGVAVVRCFPDAPRLQAALAEHAALAEAPDDLADYVATLALKHGLGPWRGGPAFGVVAVTGGAVCALYDGREWWALGRRGVVRCSGLPILAAYEVR